MAYLVYSYGRFQVRMPAHTWNDSRAVLSHDARDSADEGPDRRTPFFSKKEISAHADGARRGFASPKARRVATFAIPASVLARHNYVGPTVTSHNI